MKAKKLQITVLAVLSLMGAARLFHGQIASGTIVGTAYDQSGAIVGGAEIILTNTQTQLRRSVVTDTAGNFAAPQLPVGIYKLSASAASFKRQEVENITLLVNDKPVAKQRLPETVRMAFAFEDTFDIGEDSASPAGDYENPFPFNGTIQHIDLDLEPASSNAGATP